MDEVFDMILSANEKFEFTIRVTMLEIYNEKIQDLLDSRPRMTYQPLKTTCKCGRIVDWESMSLMPPRST